MIIRIYGTLGPADQIAEQSTILLRRPSESQDASHIKRRRSKSVKHQSPSRPATCHITNISLIKIEMPKSTKAGKKAKKAAAAAAAIGKSRRQAQAALKSTPPKAAAAAAPSDPLRSSKRKAKAATRLIASEHGPQHGSTPVGKKKKKKKAKEDDAQAQKAPESDDDSAATSKASGGGKPSGQSVEDIMRDLDQTIEKEDAEQDQVLPASPSPAEASSPAHCSQRKKKKSDESSEGEEEEESDSELNKEIVLEIDEEHRDKEWTSLQTESICTYFEDRKLSKIVGQALAGCGKFGGPFSENGIMRVLENVADTRHTYMTLVTIREFIDDAVDLAPVSNEIITDALEALEATAETHAANLSLAKPGRGWAPEKQAASEDGGTARAAQDAPEEQEAEGAAKTFAEKVKEASQAEYHIDGVTDSEDAEASEPEQDDEEEPLAVSDSDDDLLDDDEEDVPRYRPLIKKKRKIKVRAPLSRSRHSDSQIDLCRDNLTATV